MISQLNKFFNSFLKKNQIFAIFPYILKKAKSYLCRFTFRLFPFYEFFSIVVSFCLKIASNPPKNTRAFVASHKKIVHSQQANALFLLKHIKTAYLT